MLVVEDDRNQAEALGLALEREGHAVEIAADVESALDRIRAREFDLVLSDLVLGEKDGIDLLREIRRQRPDLSVVLITGHGSVETAVQAMREGAADYITKPVNLDELRARVRRELEKRRLVVDNRELRQELDRRFGLEGMIGNSEAMRRVFDVVRQVGPTEASLLILGESGTGKEVVARACHRLSQRADRRFVAINCAALTDSLIESELFGHIKGAFTGANNMRVGKIQHADGGTLFLDEIGDMPMTTQAKLLRVLEDLTVVPVGSNEEHTVDIRVFAATNNDLEEKVRDGKFREDLYYRLAVVTIEMPPLRERPEDLPLLLEYFRNEFCAKHRHLVDRIAPEVVERLRAHKWPGNVRELRNAVETMVVLDRDGEFGVDDLPRSIRGKVLGLPAPAPVAALPAPIEALDAEVEILDAPRVGLSPTQAAEALAGQTMAEVEKELIRATLAKVGGNRQRAAEMLQIGERTLYRKIKEYQLPK